MAYHAQFHTRLLQQVNDTNSRNLDLQSLLAQKDDELTQVNARLQNALTSGGTGGGRRASFSALQRHNKELTTELSNAEAAASAAEGNLTTLTKKFAEIEADLRRQILDLQCDVRKRDDLLREVAESCEPSYRPDSGYGGAEPSSASQNELKRLRTAFASLQKQFQAEKKENAKLRGLPEASVEKSRRIEEDQDDEESVPLIKRERPSVFSDFTPRPLAPPQAPMLPIPVLDSPLPTPLQESPLPMPVQESHSPMFVLASTPQTDSGTPGDTVHVEQRPSQIVPAKRKSPSKCSVASSHTPVKRKSPSKSSLASTSAKSVKIKSRHSSMSSLSSEGAAGGEEEEDDEDDDDDIDQNADFKPDPDAPRKRARLQGVDFPVKEKFEFQAVTNHLPDGDIEAFDSQEQLKDECDELWERIQKCVDSWEEAKGEAWEFEFEKAQYRPTLPPCVTTKLTSKTGRMSWEPGCEGKYACKKCVEERRPCFTWNGEEFWLLPLRDVDRNYPVKEGLEIRYWLNVE